MSLPVFALLAADALPLPLQAMRVLTWTRTLFRAAPFGHRTA